MGTPEGLKDLAEEIERLGKTDALFLSKHGWTQDGDYWVKGDHKLYSYDTGSVLNGAVSVQIKELMDAGGWKHNCVQTHMPSFKGVVINPEKWSRYTSSKTGFNYSYLEVRYLIYNELEEDQSFFDSCSEKTKQLNVLFPNEKPDVMEVRFYLKDGVGTYERID